MTHNSGPRFFVIDDEPEILTEIADYLRRHGELVSTASSYTQAELALNDDAVLVDVLITDARMPDGSGVDLAHLAVERPGGLFACILITGHMLERDLAADLQRAGVRIVRKPFSLGVLYREVLAAWNAVLPPPEIQEKESKIPGAADDVRPRLRTRNQPSPTA
jgi:DNA-binding response OmpR family regulator